MLIAYIDEIGEPGAFVSRDHPRYNTSAAFGYAGFIIPDDKVRIFGSFFAAEKKRIFKTLIEQEAPEHPGRWERKGSSIFNALAPRDHPNQLRVFDGLVEYVTNLGGHLFYYADQKKTGTPKQTRIDPVQVESAAMKETLNRLARHADVHDSNMMVVIDQINEKARSERLPNMYGHILGRRSNFEEMGRIIEPPMHIDSQLSANIQFADWIASCVGRAIDYHLIESSRYQWVTNRSILKAPWGKFTYESKVNLLAKSLGALNHSDIFNTKRPLFPENSHNLIISRTPLEVRKKMQQIYGV